MSKKIKNIYCWEGWGLIFFVFFFVGIIGIIFVKNDL